MSQEKNYHSRLLGISNALDGMIQELKNSYIDEKYSNWIIWLLLSPFRDLKKLNNLGKGIKDVIDMGFILSIIPYLSLVFGPFVYGFTNLNPTLAAITGYFTGYFFTLLFYFPMLLQFNSGHFHTGAYRTFRRQEYDLFKAAFLDDKSDYYFKGLYDYVNVILSGNQNYDQLYSMIEQRLERFVQMEKLQLETKNSLLQDRLKRRDKDLQDLTSYYDAVIQDIVSERNDLLQGIDYIIELIKDINKVLFRIKNKVFTTYDLNLISGFTLYEKRGDFLYRIRDVGTTGATPNEIPLKSELYKEWGSVRVINEDLKQPVLNKPYLNHSIISFRMKMDGSKTWVYNFHFDSDDKKANHLLVKDDIIESREVYRLIHALCLISQDLKLDDVKEAAE